MTESGWVSVERGAGTILALAIIGALCALMMATMPVASVFLGRAQSAGAADAAALAAADAASGWTAGIPCLVAASTAASNRATLIACRVEGSVVTVRVQVTAGAIQIPAQATAGPPFPLGR